MTFQEALNHLDQNRFGPLCLLTGEEPFLVQKLLDRFREKALDPAARDFNYDLFQGETIRPEEAILIAQTFPVFSSRRLIIIQNADQIKDEKEMFLTYLENPSETTLLLFVAAKPDMRKKLFSQLKKKGTMITCPSLYENEIPRWIAQEGRKKGLRFSQEGLWYFKEQTGKDLFLIQQEIEKLALNLGASDETASPSEQGGAAEVKEVSLEAVRQIVGAGRNHSIFELTRAVGEKDLKGAFDLLSSLLSEGEHPLYILTMLTRQWRMMAIAQEALQAGNTEAAAGKKVGLPPFFLSSFFQQLKRWRPSEIRRAFDLSLAADSQLKGGRQAPAFVLEALLLELCQSAPATRRYSIPLGG